MVDGGLSLVACGWLLVAYELPTTRYELPATRYHPPVAVLYHEFLLQKCHEFVKNYGSSQNS